MIRLNWRLVAIVAICILTLHFLFYSPWQDFRATLKKQQNDLAKMVYNNGDNVQKQANVAKVVVTNTKEVIRTVTQQIPIPDDQKLGNSPKEMARVNGVFVILARNSDLNELRPSILELEARFNHRYHYPYVFLNDQPFDSTFRQGIQEVTESVVEFGIIPKEHWSYPEWIDQKYAKEQREKMAAAKIIYGGSEPYRHMCRFNSGFFYRHPLLAKYEWYWRVEPSVRFPCDIDYDPFRFMKENNKLYGFTISIKEYSATIPTLWSTTVKFMKEHPELVPKDNLLHFVEKEVKAGNGQHEPEIDYNGCHFWSNFEIGSLDFMRGEAYNKYFDYLDHQGGFFYERWGDAPVHSLGVAMFMNKDQVHWFKDIGYFHGPLWNCPQGQDHKRLKCTCDPKDSIDLKNKNWSCGLDFKDLPFTPVKKHQYW